MKKAAVQYLILEVTRRCNMQCSHCLRGNTENKDMSFSVAINILKQFDTIGCLTFSGGEPTLNSELIQKIIDFIIENKINVQGFYVASNGKKVDIDMMNALAKLYAYIYQNYGIDDGQCCFDISLDQYHEEIENINQGMLKAYSFVSTRGDIQDRGLIKEGKAYENDMGMRQLNHTQEFESESWGDDCMEYETIYVNAMGNIYPCCDFSYQTQNKLPQLYVESGNINDLINEYNKRIKTI